MSEPFVYDSLCELCKQPFGAAACGTDVIFRVRPLASEGFSHCALTVREEFSGRYYERQLLPTGTDGDRRRFELRFSAPAEPELIWYSFRFWRDDGSGCFLDGTGYRSTPPEDLWQLTVYRPSAMEPTWFGQGVTYQIFPDRFFRTGLPTAENLIGDRMIHQSWDDTPEWLPDEHGEIRNRDFYGGSLAGIRAKLDYLSSLSVSTIYVNPIFESASNHRYNTADYRKIDPMLGTEEDFSLLCQEARQRGIRIILDGVFNHTGSRSRYFNADGHYHDCGAAQSKDSPYFSWYTFSHWPDKYDAWWGISTLPAVNEENPDYRRFIAEDGDSVIRRWLRAGASGWRLDVADELPDDFIALIRQVMDETKPGSVLLGEVWEDGSNKIAYSKRRRYLLGGETHGLMNYPFRTAALEWLRGGDANDFRLSMERLREHYPPSAFYSCMNFLGTHDTPRILTLLGAAEIPQDRAARAAFRLSDAEYARGKARLMLAARLLFAFPGSPAVYYGDEAGMQGFEDPFNRRTYPWGQEDAELLAFYRNLGAQRKSHPALCRGGIRYLVSSGGVLIFLRECGSDIVVCALNAGETTAAAQFSLPCASLRQMDTREIMLPENGCFSLSLPPCRGCYLTTESGECFT
jgi:cyclomaltodextrinase